MNIEIGDLSIETTQIKKATVTDDEMGVVIEYKSRDTARYAPKDAHFKTSYPMEMKALANCILHLIQDAMHPKKIVMPAVKARVDRMIMMMYTIEDLSDFDEIGRIVKQITDAYRDVCANRGQL